MPERNQRDNRNNKDKETRSSKSKKRRQTTRKSLVFGEVVVEAAALFAGRDGAMRPKPLYLICGYFILSFASMACSMAGSLYSLLMSHVSTDLLLSALLGFDIIYVQAAVHLK
jgi:hypothetical protein